MNDNSVLATGESLAAADGQIAVEGLAAVGDQTVEGTEYSVLSTRVARSPAGSRTAARIGVELFPGKGRGVVALRHFKDGDTIERPLVIVIPREEVPLLRKTKLAHYYFEWGPDCQSAAIALGYGSLYNHSYSPNARYVFREDEECLEILALGEIEAGEEITINYNNLEESAANPVKFDVH